MSEHTTREWTVDYVMELSAWAKGGVMPDMNAEAVADAHNAAVKEAYEKGKQDGVREHYVGK